MCLILIAELSNLLYSFLVDMVHWYLIQLPTAFRYRYANFAETLSLAIHYDQGNRNESPYIVGHISTFLYVDTAHLLAILDAEYNFVRADDMFQF